MKYNNNLNKNINVIIKRKNWLQEKIKNANYSYYVLNKPFLFDSEYDSLFDELNFLKKTYFNNQNISSKIENIEYKNTRNIFSYVKHESKMLSLNTGFSKNDIINFYKKNIKKLKKKNIDYVCELKFDGIAISLRYINGNLYQASTRGDGFVGENITKNIENINSIPKKINISNLSKVIDIRGEIVMFKNDLNKLNKYQKKTGKNIFMNTRNAAAGSLRQINRKISIKRKLYFFAYGIIIFKKSNLINSHSNILKLLYKTGFMISYKFKVTNNLNELINFFDKINKKREKFPYEIDGVVYKINKIKYQKILGYTSNFPKFIIAQKFPSHQSCSIIKSINLQVSRFGTLTPIAHLEPTLICGAIIKKSTLHNLNDIKNKDIRIGDYVTIKRAGDVIPKITNVIYNRRTKYSKKFIFPKKCPICNTLLIYNNKKTKLICTNYLKCQSQIIESINHFSCRKSMNIKGLGKKTISKLVKLKLITNIVDIFYLNYKKLNKISNLSSISINKLLLSIKKSKNITLDKFIYSLGIKNIGKTISKKISNTFKSIQYFIKIVKNKILNKFNINKTISKNIYIFFSKKYNINILQELIKICNII